MASRKILLISISVSFIALLTLIILLLLYFEKNRDSGSVNDTYINDSNSSRSNLPPISHPVNIDQTEKTIYETYTDSKGFEYKYPENWRFRDGREGLGLVPADLCSINCSKEILTIGSRVTEEKNLDPKELAEAQFGIGFSTGQMILINGKSTFYAIFEREEYTDITYTIVSEGVFVQAKFREEVLFGINTAKYRAEAESIIRSIKFNN